ncbi:phage head morphogenesis protein, partial [bacterium]|nr:phage head morphogenesis protein [bacterium]
KIRRLVAQLPRTLEPGEDSKALKSEKRKATLKANRAYTWQVDNYLMDRTMATIRQILTGSLLSGDTSWSNRWWMNGHLDSAYEQGTLQSFYSAQLITRGVDSPSTNALQILNADAQLQTQPYLSRLQLVHGRVFEDMLGLTGDMVSDLRRTLTDGMARGLGIRDVSGMINDRVGVGLSRAKRIARTEINRAYTNAYMDESEELNENLKEDQYSIRQMHVSALIPDVTRKSHSDRHGGIYTRKEQLKWWDSGSNRLNCLCSVIDVLVDLKTGKSIQQSLIDRTRERGKQFFKVH